MKPFKVLMLVENNGYPRDFRVRREAEALRDAGFQVSVVCPRDPGERWHESRDGIDVLRFPPAPGGRGVLGYALEFGWATFAMLALAVWRLARHGLDVVHAANPPDTLFVLGAALRPFGVRFVFDHHDFAPEIYLSQRSGRRRGLVHAVLRALQRASYATADVVVATNETYRQRAIEVGRLPPHRVFVVRNGPPLAYRPLLPPPGLVAQATHLIGYVGTIGAQDGVDCWVRAIDHLVNVLERRDFLAVVIGDGDALPALRQMVEARGLQRWVHFTGRLAEDEARRHLSATSLCVQPDPSGPLNDHCTMNKLMEYMALGKATVAFDLPETRYSGGEAAVYVPGNDEPAFARQVDRLLADPDERRRRGEFGRRRVASALAWEYSVAPLIRAYADGLGLRPAKGAALSKELR